MLVMFTTRAKRWHIWLDVFEVISIALKLIFLPWCHTYFKWKYKFPLKLNCPDTTSFWLPTFLNSSTKFLYFSLCNVTLCCPLRKVAPAALFFKTAFLCLPLCVSHFCLWYLAVLQCWDLIRSLGGASCSSRWAALCWLPSWSGLLSAHASRRRLNVSHIYVFDLGNLTNRWSNPCQLFWLTTETMVSSLKPLNKWGIFALHV